MNDDVRYRKINPIYGAIDAGNYKGAIKLCQRKDIIKWDITKALNAYCLVMTLKLDEGLAMAREVKVSMNIDTNKSSKIKIPFLILCRRIIQLMRVY
jgi:hypothetical protein